MKIEVEIFELNQYQLIIRLSGSNTGFQIQSSISNRVSAAVAESLKAGIFFFVELLNPNFGG